MANRVTLATRYSWKTEDHWQPDIHGKQRDNGDLLFMANRGTLATRYSWQTEGPWQLDIHVKRRDPGN